MRSVTLHMRSALFWHVTQCRVVIIYRRFGTVSVLAFQDQEILGYLDPSQICWPLRMRRIDCPKSASCVCTVLFYNSSFHTKAVHQRQHVDAVGCGVFFSLLLFLAGWSACLLYHFANCYWVYPDLQSVHCTHLQTSLPEGLRETRMFIDVLNRSRRPSEHDDTYF